MLHRGLNSGYVRLEVKQGLTSSRIRRPPSVQLMCILFANSCSSKSHWSPKFHVLHILSWEAFELHLPLVSGRLHGCYWRKFSLRRWSWNDLSEAFNPASNSHVLFLRARRELSLGHASLLIRVIHVNPLSSFAHGSN